MEKELLAGEIFLQPVNTTAVTAEIDSRLKDVEEQLKRNTLSLTGYDQAAAFASGMVAGAIDSFVVGETNFFDIGQKTVGEQLRDIADLVIKKYDKNIEKDRFTFAKPVETGVTVDGSVLEKLSKKDSIGGLIAAALVQLGHGGMLRFDKKRPEAIEKEQEEKNGEKSKDNKTVIAVVSIIVGILKWLSTSRESDEQSEGKFRLIGRVRELVQSSPRFMMIMDMIERWQKQLPNELKEKEEKEGVHPGIPDVFMSFFSMLAIAPGMSETGLPEAMHTFKEAKRLGINKIPIVESLTKQALPVVVNEILVRTFYFATRLAVELKNTEDIKAINWENVLPFGNRNIDRLLMLASITLNVADTADAAIRAALDSRGDFIAFSVKFVTRFNFVAAGRAAIAVIKDCSDEKMERELLHEKRMLTEEKTEKVLAVLEEYQQKLEQRLADYITEDLTVFMEGINVMDRGIGSRDSELVIKGNVMIQRVLGREPQFTNQAEFNDLMDSDIPLIL